MGGLNGTERRAQARFEREVLACVVALGAAPLAAPLEQVEQSMGYYRQAAAGNPVQQLLGRRLRGAIGNLAARGLLDASAPDERLRPTPAGRAAVWEAQQPWWQRALGVGAPTL